MKFYLIIHIKSITIFASNILHTMTPTVVFLIQKFEDLSDKINFGRICRTTLVVRFSLKKKFAVMTNLRTDSSLFAFIKMWTKF